jgi:cbb3-type cytochrome oxidase maturation protein
MRTTDDFSALLPVEHRLGDRLLLVPMALLLGLTGLAAFLWSLSSGQYDDVDGAALRILDNDDIEAGPERP